MEEGVWWSPHHSFLLLTQRKIEYTYIVVSEIIYQIIKETKGVRRNIGEDYGGRLIIPSCFLLKEK